MTEYALVNSQTGALDLVASNVDPNAGTKPPFVWMPVARVARPSVNDATQVAERNNSVVGSEYVFDWTVRSKTKAELDADTAAAEATKTSQVNDNVNAMVGKALFKIVNEIRTLQSQPTLTPAQFKAWFRAQQP